MEKAIKFYSLLGYDQVLFDETGNFDDWSEIKGGKENYRRVLLTQQNPSGGGFSKLAGKIYRTCS